MKWIIYLLLLLNIGLLVWHYPALQKARLATPSGETEQTEGTLSLVLLREARQKSLANASQRQCLSFGPFADRPQGQKALSILKATGMHAELKISKDARRKAYWVLLPPAESRDKARESIARLKKLNVKDYFLVATGEMTNAVSLGVFSKFESAHRRIKEMQELGFRPEFKQVELPRREYWVEWPSKDKPTLAPGLVKKLKRINPAAKLRDRACH